MILSTNLWEITPTKYLMNTIITGKLNNKYQMKDLYIKASLMRWYNNQFYNTSSWSTLQATELRCIPFLPK